MKYAVLISFFLPLFLFQNCSKVQFSELAASSNVQSASVQCRTTLVDTNRKVKVLLLVDASGSNQETDPTKRWRAAAINDLVNRYGSKDNFYFSIITFQGLTTTSQIVSTQGNTTFSNQQSEIQYGIAKFMANTDGGGTPYKAALMSAKALIKQDHINNASDNALYTVALISDGAPSDYLLPEEIIPDTKEIVEVVPGRIILNGVFYYNNAVSMATTNTKYLQNFAAYGQGAFITANSNESLKVDDIMQIQKEICN